MLGTDGEHNRYFYFPMFYHDCRLYRETPSKDEGDMQRRAPKPFMAPGPTSILHDEL